MRVVENGAINRTFINLVICSVGYTAFHYFTEGSIDKEIIPFVGGFLMGVVILVFNAPKIKVVEVAVEVENGDNNPQE